MSDEKPTGVFVRLPLSEGQIRAADAIAKEIAENNAENEWRFARHHFAACDDLVRSIGTPVTGGNLQPIGKVAGHFSDGQPMVRILNHPHLPYETEIALYSDAQAQITALEAEVVRLRTEDDKEITQVIEERDECEQVINDLYQAVMGHTPEWSNHFGYRDAVEDVVDCVHMLRTKYLKGDAA